MIHNILVIEDNPADVELVRIYLQQTDFRHKMMSTATLGEGILLAKENTIDIVLLDLGLPDSNGYSTIRRFREGVPSVPVIVFTGMRNEIMGLQSVRAGAQDFLVKGDFDGRRLVKTIRYSLHRFKMQIQLQQEALDKSRVAKKMRNIQGVANLVSWEMEVVSSVMEWSQGMYDLLGLRPNVLQPSLANYMEYVYPEDRSRVTDFFEKATQTQVHNQIQHRFLVNGKTIKHISLSTKVIFDDDDGTLKLIGIVQDESDKQSTDQGGSLGNTAGISLKQLSRLHNWPLGLSGQLLNVGRIIHQMNKARPSSAQRKLIEELEAVWLDATSTATIVQGLHHIRSNSWKSKKQDISLKDHFARFEQTSKHIYKSKGLKLSVKLEKNLGKPVRIDTHLLDQYLLLLLRMTQKLSHQDSTIRLDVKAPQVDKRTASLSLIWSFNTQLNAVEDINGLMQEDKLLLAYHKEEDSPMVDLGFADAAVQQLGGQNVLKSSGANHFSLETTIPVETTEMKTTGTKTSAGPLNVLLVEDHVLVRIKVKKQLKNWDNQMVVEEAKNVEEALEKFSNLPFDLVLMDLQLKDQESWKLVNDIRSLKDVPIIGVSSQSTLQEEKQAKSQGLIGYLVQPISDDALYTLLDQEFKTTELNTE